MKTRLIPLLLTAMCISGCISVGPDYEPPEAEVPDAWHQAVVTDLESEEPRLQTWWTVFNDDTLNGLIDRVATNNLDLKVAAARKALDLATSLRVSGRTVPVG